MLIWVLHIPRPALKNLFEFIRTICKSDLSAWCEICIHSVSPSHSSIHLLFQDHFVFSFSSSYSFPTDCNKLLLSLADAPSATEMRRSLRI